MVVLGLVVAMSPLPVLAEVLSMTESGRVRPAVALAVGYSSTLLVIALAAVLLGAEVSGSGPSRATAIVDLVAGVLLLVYLGVRMRRRAAGTGASGLPGWIARVGSMSVPFAFGLGVFLPPYVVAVAAGNEIVRQGLAGSSAWPEALLFTAVASIGVITPIVVVVAAPSGADARLASWRRWLEAHWQGVAAGILLVAGTYLVAKGLYELSQV